MKNVCKALDNVLLLVTVVVFVAIVFGTVVAWPMEAGFFWGLLIIVSWFAGIKE